MTTPNDAPLTDAEIAAFRELASKATPGPVTGFDGVVGWLKDSQGRLVMYVCGCPDCSGERPEEERLTNVSLFIAARNIADRLAAEWQEKTAENERLELEVASARTIMERIRQVCEVKTRPIMSYSGARYEKQIDEWLAGNGGVRLRDQLHELFAKTNPGLNFWHDKATKLEAELAAANERADKLQAFKDWVHGYLDSHGVPHHPPGTHGAEGCRIGDRMDWLMAELAAANERIAELEFSRAEAEALVMSHEGKIDQLRQQLAEREAERLECNQRADKYDPRDVAMLGGDPSL